MESRKVLCLLSGGIDSSTLIGYYKSTGFEVESISADYGQKHSKEIDSAKKIANFYGINHDVIDLHTLGRLISASALTGSSNVPEDHYTHENQKQTVVPNRNMILLSIAAGIAITRKIPFVATAVHANDFAIYPDCRPSFIHALQATLLAGNYDEVNVLTPFINITKGEIVSLGHNLKIPVPYEYTWSCYNGREMACGKCGTCQERLEAFRFAKHVDPIRYEL